MFLRILTLTLCLTNALEYRNFKETSMATNYSEPLYNVHEWVTKLQLERCAFVGIGLKLYAIFVEDGILGRNKREQNKYFLGICQQSTLEQWNLCSPELAKRRKHKCRFKLGPYKFRSRVHRRFCDLRVMVNNKDCICEPTIFGDDMQKVKGFPTCFIPPLPSSLCKYSVCGVSKCKAATVEDRVHTVECDSNCKGGNPFCEYPIDITSRVPEVRSSWSKWRESRDSESPRETWKKHSIATCINKYTGRGDVDCLGPGTGCCPRDIQNCTCDTSEENGTLLLERIMYEDHRVSRLRAKHSDLDSRIQNFGPRRKLNLYVEDSDDYHIEDDIDSGLQTFNPRRKLNLLIEDSDDYDIEDDENSEADLDEDILLEENIEEIARVSTPVELEKHEAVEELKREMEEITSQTEDLKSTGSHSSYTILLIILGLFLSGQRLSHF